MTHCANPIRLWILAGALLLQALSPVTSRAVACLLDAHHTHVLGLSCGPTVLLEACDTQSCAATHGEGSECPPCEDRLLNRPWLWLSVPQPKTSARLNMQTQALIPDGPPLTLTLRRSLTRSSVYSLSLRQHIVSKTVLLL